MKDKKEKIDVKYVAQLAKIRLTKSQQKALSKELTEILAFVEKLKELDTSKISALTHVISLGNVLREDKILSSLSQKEILDLTPKKEGSFIKVPKVIDFTREGEPKAKPRRATS